MEYLYEKNVNFFNAWNKEENLYYSIHRLEYIPFSYLHFVKVRKATAEPHYFRGKSARKRSPARASSIALDCALRIFCARSLLRSSALALARAHEMHTKKVCFCCHSFGLKLNGAQKLIELGDATILSKSSSNILESNYTKMRQTIPFFTFYVI